jgi:hypothetical protein
MVSYKISRYFIFFLTLFGVVEKHTVYSVDDLVAAAPATSSTQSKGASLTPLVLPTPDQQPKQGMPAKIPEINVPIEVNYLLPGIAALQGGQWVGNDHLFGISNNIGVIVEIVKPVGVTIPITEERVQKQIGQMLKTGHINPRLQIVGSTPLPYLHVLIMLNPIENGYAAYIAVRLFEPVALQRFHLKIGTTFQAITWERQEFIVFPTEQFQEQIGKVLQSMMMTFIERATAEPPKRQLEKRS